MSELDETPRSYSGALLAALAVALLAGVGGLIWSYTLSSRSDSQQTELADAKQQNMKLAPICAKPTPASRWLPRSWANPWG